MTAARKKKKRKKPDGEDDTVAVKGMRSELRSNIATTTRQAENYCGEKHHLYDGSARVADADEVHKKWIVKNLISSPAATLQALCDLADELQPSLEGSICDFDGDRVLLNLDKSVVTALKACTPNTLPAKVLDRVAEVFSEDYKPWTERAKTMDSLKKLFQSLKVDLSHES